MTECVIIQTTTDNDECTDKLLNHLLNNRLSSDVQLSKIDSHY